MGHLRSAVFRSYSQLHRPTGDWPAETHTPSRAPLGRDRLQQHSLCLPAGLCGGIVARRASDGLAGTRRGFSLSVFLWSLAAMAHALVRSVFGFGAARFALGLGESGSFPASIKAVAEWFPKRERALATGIFNSGTNLGAIITPLLVPW